jgi:2-oxoglutarate ferredoxin oxidoreductase subunit alpha
MTTTGGGASASIVLAGAAGQGIATVERLLGRILKLAGYQVFSSSEFMSRIRGGTNSTEIRISAEPVEALVDRIDVLVAFNDSAVEHIRKQGRLSEDTLVLGEKENMRDAGPNTATVPFEEIAREVGNRIYANTVAVGLVAGMLGVDSSLVTEFLEGYFRDRGDEIVSGNVEAARRGLDLGAELASSGRVGFSIPRGDSAADDLLLSGTEAVGLGALAGGCDFISSYPMSPSTGVLVYLAQHGDEFGMVVEQAEDEISALNMALGASYAGARSMVTTSGGGFALMVEALSLAGVAELPVVIHLAQRPGPGTGMPTRTEQGDLLFTLRAAHGEFPRAILAPGTPKEAFELVQHAFDLAAAHQVPVIVLTDQYFVDSIFQLPSLAAPEEPPDRHIVESDADYVRYRITDSGISPRGIPGYGSSLAVADSHEHDEIGHMTEDFGLRVRMNDKRLRKEGGLREAALAPVLIGPEDYRTLVIGWGSTKPIIREALDRMGLTDVAQLHFPQVYPLHNSVADLLSQAERTVVVENNATGQFATLLRLETGHEATDTVHKYDGMAFSVEGLQAELAAILDESE